MLAHWRQQATLMTIIGELDAANSDNVYDFITRFIRADVAVVIDLRGVVFFAARGISMVQAIDAACRAAKVPWALVPSDVVTRVLTLRSSETTLPTFGSVPEALSHVTPHTSPRFQLAVANRSRSARHEVRVPSPSAGNNETNPSIDVDLW